MSTLLKLGTDIRKMRRRMGGIPFSKELSADYFNYAYSDDEKKVLAKYWKGEKIDGQEEFVDRYVATSDGTDGKWIDIPTITVTTATAFEIEWKTVMNNSSRICSTEIYESRVYCMPIHTAIRWETINIIFSTIATVNGEQYTVKINYNGNPVGANNFACTVTHKDGTVQTETQTVSLSGMGNFLVERVCALTGTDDNSYSTQSKDFEIKFTVDGTLESYYKLNGDVLDYSGNGNHGTNHGIDLTATIGDKTPAIVSSRLVGDFGTTDTIGFTDLSGVTITSYLGTATLSISGNNIVATGGAGTAYDILLSDGTFLPLEGSCYDVSGNDNHGTNSGVDLTATTENYVDGLYSWLLRKGFGYGVQKLRDWDMEDSGITPFTWLASGSAISKVSGIAPNSTQSLRVARSGSNYPSAYQSRLTVGVCYRVTGYCKSDGNKAPRIMNNAVILWDGYANTDLQKFDVTFMASHASLSFYINGSLVDGQYIDWDDIQVQEIIPRITDLSGYADTVTEEHPALEVGNNLAPVFFDFPADLTDDIMDRSDTTIYNANARSGIYYDSSHPRQWHASELTAQNQIDWFNTGYKARNFCKTENSSYLLASDGSLLLDVDGFPILDATVEVEKMKALLLYDSQRTAEQAIKVAGYLRKLTFKEVE